MTKDLSPDYRDFIRDVVASGPFGRHVGMSVDELEPDRAVVRMWGAPHILNGMGIVHGGATATLLDAAATAAAWATPDAKQTTRGTTVSMTINYIGAGQDGDMIAEGVVVSRGGTLTVVDVIAHDESERIVAKAQVTYKLDLARDRRMEKS